MNHSELEILVRDARAGNKDARGTLFEYLNDRKTFGETLYSFVRSKCPKGDPAYRIVDTEDIVVSALADAFASFGRFRGDSAGELVRWLQGVLRTKIRKHRDSNTVSGGQANVAVEDDGPSADDRLLAKELREEIQSAINELPLAYNLVVRLRFEGLSHQQISDSTGVALDTIRKRFQRASDQIANIIAERDRDGRYGQRSGRAASLR